MGSTGRSRRAAALIALAALAAGAGAADAAQLVAIQGSEQKNFGRIALTFDHGVKVSGATVHLVEEALDAGPIVLQEAVPVEADDTPETLAARILEAEHRLYPRAVRILLEGRARVEGRRVLVAEPA